MSLRKLIESKLSGLLGRDPEAVVVTFLTGDGELSQAMADEVRALIPERRHIRVGMQGANAEIVLKGGTTGELYGELRARLGSYRVSLAAVMVGGGTALRPLRRAAFLFAPGKIVAYNRRLERHRVQLRSLLSSLLFMNDVALDRIELRPKWLAPWKRDRTVYPETFREFAGRPLSARRRRIGVLAPYLPWPLSRADAVRMYHLLREAATEFDIFLFAFREGEAEGEAARLMEFCARVLLVDKPRYREPRWSTWLPSEARELDSPTLRRLWREVCRNNDIHLRQVEQAAMARYGGDILVEHGITFDLFRQIHERARILSSWWDMVRWRRYERRVARQFRRVVVKSDRGAALLAGARTAVIPDGVDLERFRPVLEMPGQRLLFVGSFGHFPNVLAYRFFTERVWPRLSAKFPEVSLTVVAGPDHRTYWRTYTGMAGPPSDAWITMHDFVADVRPFYETANVVIVPGIVSAGASPAVLEAMAMERAVVSTPPGCAGLELVHGETVWIGEGENGFLEGAGALLNDPALRERLARNARRHAEERFDWRVLGERQRRLYGEMLPPLVSVRPATEADLAEMERIQIACAEASHWPAERYLAYTCRVALHDGALAGFLVSRQNGPGEREILNLAVAPQYRRLGVGTALLREEIGSGGGEYFLEVRESNAGAQELYRRLGFRDAGRRPQYYDDPPETAVVMRLQS